MEEGPMNWRRWLAISYAVLCFASLFSAELPFPFVQYQMFHRPVSTPLMELYRVEASNPGGDREILTPSFFKPMSLREVYEVFRYRPTPMGEALARRATARAKQMLPQYRDFSVVEQRCDCLSYYKLNPRPEPLVFAARSCEVRQIGEVLP
jgi:hypothetical protein